MSETSVGARAELALMGVAVPIDKPTELEVFLNAICRAVGKKFSSELLEWYTEKDISKRPKLHHIVTNTIMEMPVVTITLSQGREKYNLLSEDGVFSYCINLDEPLFSEYGYTFFEKRSGACRRIG